MKTVNLNPSRTETLSPKENTNTALHLDFRPQSWHTFCASDGASLNNQANSCPLSYETEKPRTETIASPAVLRRGAWNWRVFHAGRSGDFQRCQLGDAGFGNGWGLLPPRECAGGIGYQSVCRRRVLGGGRRRGHQYRQVGWEQLVADGFRDGRLSTRCACAGRIGQRLVCGGRSHHGRWHGGQLYRQVGREQLDLLGCGDVLPGEFAGSVGQLTVCGGQVLDGRLQPG